MHQLTAKSDIRVIEPLDIYDTDTVTDNNNKCYCTVHSWLILQFSPAPAPTPTANVTAVLTLPLVLALALALALPLPLPPKLAIFIQLFNIPYAAFIQIVF
jgi:hypothetical protein